jgi:hypothetical protein
VTADGRGGGVRNTLWGDFWGPQNTFFESWHVLQWSTCSQWRVSVAGGVGGVGEEGEAEKRVTCERDRGGRGRRGGGGGGGWDGEAEKRVTGGGGGGGGGGAVSAPPAVITSLCTSNTALIEP